jgi:hypothetical protein
LTVAAFAGFIVGVALPIGKALVGIPAASTVAAFAVFIVGVAWPIGKAIVGVAAADCLLD